MRLVIAAHALAAGAIIIASVLTLRFVVLPLWLGVLVGLLLYALTLVLTKADDGDEEAPLSHAVSSNEPQTGVHQTPIREPAWILLRTRVSEFYVSKT